MEGVRPGMDFEAPLRLVCPPPTVSNTITYGFPATSPGGSGRVGSIAPGIGGLNPLKTAPGGGMPSGNG